jgi:TolA-binding protein
MSAMSSTIQADFPAGSLPIRGPATLDSGDLEDDPFASEHQPELVVTRKSSLGLLIMFCVGIGVTVAWYTFGGAAREAIAGMSPQLAWMAPQPAVVAPVADPAAPAVPTIDQQLSAALPDIDAVRQNVDRIATAQDKIIKSIDQLSAGQEQLTKEIAKLQAVEQYILYKNSEPPATTRSAPAVAAPARRPPVPLPLTPPTAPAAPQGAPPAH